MEILSQRFFVSHGQICVFRPGIDVPFNDLTERHCTQGFAWRAGSVTFLTVDDGGSYRLTAYRDDGLTIRDDSALVIRVPWYVGSERCTNVANILFDESTILLEEGSYQLQYECSPVSCQVEYEAELDASCDFRNSQSLQAAIDRIEPKQFIRLSFAPNSSPVFDIVRADGIMVTKTDDLLLTALPAI